MNVTFMWKCFVKIVIRRRFVKKDQKIAQILLWRDKLEGVSL